MLKKKLYAIKKVSAPLPASTLVSSFSWWAVCWSSAGPFRATPTVIGRIFLAPAPSCWPLASACWSSTGSLPAKKMKNFPSTLAVRWHQPKLPSRWLWLPTRLTGWYRMNINSSPSSKRHLVMCPTRWNWSMKWHQFTNLIVTTNRTKSIIIRLPIHEKPGPPPSSDPSTISFSIYLSKKNVVSTNLPYIRYKLSGTTLLLRLNASTMTSLSTIACLFAFYGLNKTSLSIHWECYVSSIRWKVWSMKTFSSFYSPFLLHCRASLFDLESFLWLPPLRTFIFFHFLFKRYTKYIYHLCACILLGKIELLIQYTDFDLFHRFS